MIVLIGLMGSGKTSVGAALGKRLGLPFVDSDQIIERNKQMKVREIFSELGEEEFRNYEASTIQEICRQEDDFVLAVGGGAILNLESCKALHERADIVVWLDAPNETLVERTSSDSNRPLLDGGPDEVIESMRLHRTGLYQKLATHKVESKDMNFQQIVDLISSLIPDQNQSTCQ